ncbi:ISKra4 family transposase, partial [Streptomyces sp. NPDC006996]
MEPYDNRGTPEAFARSVSAFHLLTAALSGQEAGEWTHGELEEHLQEAGRALMRQLLQDHLDLRAMREEEHLVARPFVRVTGPDGILRPWREKGHERWLSTVFGHVRVRRIAHRGPGVSNVHPADVLLSL